MSVPRYIRKRTVIYVDDHGQVPFRYVRILTLWRGIEFAVTFPERTKRG